MAAPRKYPDELRERSIRLVMDLVEVPGGPNINGARRRVGEQLGINEDTLRSWGTFAKLTTRGRSHVHIHDHLAGDRSQPRLVESHVHITAAATAAGAKVLLVGDWAQLSPVQAGGAFKLLADAAGPGVATLHDVFRFRCEWERDAILRLRVGDETVGEEHATHGRLESGLARTCWTCCS